MLESWDFMERQSKRTKVKGLSGGFAKVANGSAMAVCGVAGIAVLVMAFLVTSDVFMRYLLNAPSKWINEIITYLMVVLISLGLAYTQREGAHIRVDFLLNRLSKTARGWVDLITLVLFFVYAVILLYFTSTNCVFSWKLGTTSMTIMQFPVAPWQTFIPLGLAILALLLIRIIYTRVIQIGRRKTG